MALFQRQPQVSDPTLFYTVGLNKTVLVVGLGNVGEEYDDTRHNVGFMAVDQFVDKNDELQPWLLKKDLKCMLSSGQIGSTRVIVIKPTTFMNLSGESVSAVMHFFKLNVGQVIVLHDELDVDFGQVRLRQGGSSAGHNGIKSVTQHIGDDYGRVRIGIGPKQPARIKSEDFVLQKFSDDEKGQLPNLLRETTAIISEFVHGGPLPAETRHFII